MATGTSSAQLQAAGTSAITEEKDVGGDGVRNWDEEYYVQLYGDYLEDGLAKKVYDKPDKRPLETLVQWKEFHMLVAVLSSMRDDDPGRKVGACIVNADNKIVGIGHNKLPDGVNKQTFPYWENKDVKKCGFMNTKYPYVCHAAIHAILNKNAESLKGCTLYTTLFPSHEDAKMIIQGGITKVVYLSDIHKNRTFTHVAKHMFKVKKKPEGKDEIEGSAEGEREDLDQSTGAGKDSEVLVEIDEYIMIN